MKHSATASDRPWHRTGGRGRAVGSMQGDAWMLIHEASPALYLDLPGAWHDGSGAEPRHDRPFRRLLDALGGRRPADPGSVPSGPTAAPFVAEPPMRTGPFEADPAVAEPDIDDSAGIMLGLVVVAQVIAAAAATMALAAGSGWLAALLVHMAIGATALLGSAVIVAHADQVRRAVRPATALGRAGRRLVRAV